MVVDFAAVIREHLELRRRNAALEYVMPLARYLAEMSYPRARSLSATWGRAEPVRGCVEPGVDDTDAAVPPADGVDWFDEQDGPTSRARGDPGREAARSQGRDFDWGD